MFLMVMLVLLFAGCTDKQIVDDQNGGQVIDNQNGQVDSGEQDVTPNEPLEGLDDVFIDEEEVEIGELI